MSDAFTGESQNNAGRRDTKCAARGMGVRRALAAGAVPEQGQMAGRVEHVASGRSEHFGSLPELLAFFGQVLRNLQEDVE
jgi:hypothetical protein